MYIRRAVALTFVLALFAGGSRADAQDSGVVDAADFLIWRSNFGTSASETAELFLWNRCRQVASVKVTRLDIIGQAGNDNLITLPPGASVVTQLTRQYVPGGSSDRQYAALVASALPDLCASPGRTLIDQAIAIVGSDGSTRHMVRSDGELVQAVSDEVRSSAVTRVGTGQRIEVMASNVCGVPVSITLGVTEVETGKTTFYETLVAPEQGHVVPLTGDHRNWIEVFSFSLGVGRAEGPPCPPGQPGITASAHLVDPDGSTVAIALLIPAIQKG